jgi:hypothetical protein
VIFLRRNNMSKKSLSMTEMCVGEDI